MLKKYYYFLFYLFFLNNKTFLSKDGSITSCFHFYFSSRSINVFKTVFINQIFSSLNISWVVQKYLITEWRFLLILFKSSSSNGSVGKKWRKMNFPVFLAGWYNTQILNCSIRKVMMRIRYDNSSKEAVQSILKWTFAGLNLVLSNHWRSAIISNFQMSCEMLLIFSFMSSLKICLLLC